MLRVKMLHKIRGEDVVGRYEIDYMMMVELAVGRHYCIVVWR
jgi:hypothetical protein